MINKILTNGFETFCDFFRRCNSMIPIVIKNNPATIVKIGTTHNWNTFNSAGFAAAAAFPKKKSVILLSPYKFVSKNLTIGL